MAHFCFFNLHHYKGTANTEIGSCWSGRSSAALDLQNPGDRLLSNPADRRDAAWMVVSPDRRKAILSYVLKTVTANAPVCCLRLRGLDPERIYQVLPLNRRLSGGELMNGGLPVPELYGDDPAMQFEITAVEK